MLIAEITRPYRDYHQLKANPPDDRWRFLFALYAWVNRVDYGNFSQPGLRPQIDNNIQQLLALRAQAAPYAEPAPAVIYRGISRATLNQQPRLTSWSKNPASARRFARLSPDGIVIQENTANVDVYTVVPNVIRRLNGEERFNLDFYRARGEHEVLVVNYHPSAATKIVWENRTGRVRYQT